MTLLPVKITIFLRQNYCTHSVSHCTHSVSHWKRKTTFRRSVARGSRLRPRLLMTLLPVKTQFSNLITTIHGWLQKLCRSLAVKTAAQSELWLSHNLNPKFCVRILAKCWWWHYSQSKLEFSDLVTTIAGCVQGLCTMLPQKVWAQSEVWLSHNPSFSFV